MREEVGKIEGNFSKELRTLSGSLSQLGDIKATLDRSISQTTPQEFGELRRVANIRPNGASVNWTGDRRDSTGIAIVGPSSVSRKLHEAFIKFNEHDMVASASLFNEVQGDDPAWPYAYFYLGLNALNAHQPSAKFFEDAAQHFQAFRKAGIVEPELLLYESMARTFTGDFDTTRSLLKKLSEFKDNAQDITVLAISKSSPEDVVARFDSISKKHKVPLVAISAEIR